VCATAAGEPPQHAPANAADRAQGEWVGIDARTDVGAGHGVASGGLYDELGLYGHVLQAIVFNKRAEKRSKL
jgi:hypothetical protein